MRQGKTAIHTQKEGACMQDFGVAQSEFVQLAPHGQSYAWEPGLVWANVLPDVALAIGFFVIPFFLLKFSRRRRDVRFTALLISFAIFVLSSGLAHVLAIWNVWHTDYTVEAAMKVLAATAALPTAILLWRSLRELIRLPSKKQLREANESLARANRELEAFTASVSHDLRSPLTTIAGQAGLLEISLPNPTEDQRRRLGRIQSSVKQMSELIDALLTLSRISRHTLIREIVDVSALVDSIVSDLRQRDPERHIDVAVQPNMTVHGDRRLIADLFTNLITNAWKFTSKTPEAHIEIGIVHGGPMATLFVRDNGAGFDMAYEKKLFKPFQRLHGNSEFEGTGVGLATVARIVDRHGGRIWAEAKPNSGAVFYFSLPSCPITDQIPVNTPAAV
jgi:signal transduction histidine kinase